MYPVVTTNARVISDKNVVIGGYQFSKKTSFLLCLYAISHDEDTFPEPFTFKPERWLRDGRERPHPFGSIPFGFGVRGCVGRRIAELEMYMALFRLIRQFEIKPDPTMGELKCISRTVLVPDQPLTLHFVDRGCENTAWFAFALVWMQMLHMSENISGMSDVLRKWNRNSRFKTFAITNA